MDEYPNGTNNVVAVLAHTGEGELAGDLRRHRRRRDALTHMRAREGKLFDTESRVRSPLPPPELRGTLLATAPPPVL